MPAGGARARRRGRHERRGQEQQRLEAYKKGRVAAALVEILAVVPDQDFSTFSIEATRMTFDDSSSCPITFTSKPKTASGLSSFSMV